VTEPLKIDAEAVLWSAPERERAGRPLIVLLHGYASHEGDLFGLSPRLPLGPVIASVRAPLEANGGYAWFPIEPGRRGDPDPVKVDAAARAVLQWLDTVESTSTSLLGFSQGGAIALQLLRLAPRRFAATVMLSGFLADGTKVGDNELEVLRPRVFWGRGTLDSVITTEAIARTELWLPEHADVTAHIYEDLGHSVSAAELGDVNEFLRGL
jgi:phospholipase/carboxylesterase